MLRGELELAGRPGRSREELAAAVRGAAEEAERLARITDDLLLLARGDDGPARPAARARRTCGSSSRAAPSAPRPAWRRRGVTCRIDVPAGTRACVDPDRIRQAVDNLLDNALRFAPAGSVIVIAAGKTAPTSSSRSATPVPASRADFLPHAFERFRRPDTGRSRDGGGAGLGLAIVAAIAVAHGGTATARNGPGGGAVVSLRLPYAASGVGESRK